MVKNYMEDYVWEQLIYLLNHNKQYADICKCEKCLENMFSLALNDVKPLYYTTKEGEVYSTYSQIPTQNKNDVITSLTKAIEIVINNPH
ncbi:MAG: late competence development ComFB family protein [Oscillospiraceae bacterium]